MRRLILVLGCLPLVSSQVPLPTQIPQTKFSSGQNVVPSYDGWIRNPDGSFTFVFGYFNRNFSEELVIPPGPDNNVEPGGPDQGQPTYFLPRRQAWAYRVRVPADWGQKELVWTITSHGRTEKAYAQLLLEEEITERLIMSRGNLSPGEDDPNKPPSVTIASVRTASVASPLTLTASVTDDGLPKPRAAPKARTTPGQTDRGQGPRAGLAVTWLQYRGPAKVTFDASGPIPVANGQAVTTAHFTKPGTYVLRATATDGALSTRADVTITVN
jgi:hypothetical protein